MSKDLTLKKEEMESFETKKMKNIIGMSAMIIKIETVMTLDKYEMN